METETTYVNDSDSDESPAEEAHETQQAQEAHEENVEENESSEESMDGGSDSEYLTSTSSLNTSDINIRHYRR